MMSKGGCVDQIFTLKVRKHRRKNLRCIGFYMDLEKAYDRVGKEALQQVLRIMMWVVNC